MILYRLCVVDRNLQPMYRDDQQHIWITNTGGLRTKFVLHLPTARVYMSQDCRCRADLLEPCSNCKENLSDKNYSMGNLQFILATSNLDGSGLGLINTDVVYPTEDAAKSAAKEIALKLGPISGANMSLLQMLKKEIQEEIKKLEFDIEHLHEKYGRLEINDFSHINSDGWLIYDTPPKEFMDYKDVQYKIKCLREWLPHGFKPGE